MVDFSALRRTDTAALAQKLKDTAGGNSNQKDERFFTLTIDKSKTGSAVIRFLPISPDDHGKLALPLGEYFQHAFQNQTNKKWFIEHCPTSLGAGTDCPVCSANTELWETGDDTKKKVAQARKRKKWYVANIFVVNDPGNPENNGKVMLFRFGKQIFDKINAAMNPQFADDVAVNVFDLWQGANFKLRQTFEDNFPKFDKSDFSSVSALLDGNDAALEKIWRSQYSLIEFTPEGLKKIIKTTNELQTQFDRVVNGAARKKQDEDEETNLSTSEMKSPAERFEKKAESSDLPWDSEPETKTSTASAIDPDIDEILKEFQNK